LVLLLPHSEEWQNQKENRKQSILHELAEEGFWKKVMGINLCSSVGLAIAVSTSAALGGLEAGCTRDDGIGGAGMPSPEKCMEISDYPKAIEEGRTNMWDCFGRASGRAPDGELVTTAWSVFGAFKAVDYKAAMDEAKGYIDTNYNKDNPGYTLIEASVIGCYGPYDIFGTDHLWCNGGVIVPSPFQEDAGTQGDAGDFHQKRLSPSDGVGSLAGIYFYYGENVGNRGGVGGSGSK